MDMNLAISKYIKNSVIHIHTDNLNAMCSKHGSSWETDIPKS